MTYTPNLGASMALLQAERERVDKREKAGMPTATAATVTGAPIGTAGASNQATLAARLRSAFSGGPTAGTTQLFGANEQAKKGLYASAFSRPNGAAGLTSAMRSTANTGALMDAQTARQADILRAQEQQAALGQYAALGSQMAAADQAEANEANKIGMANAGFQQQTALANQQAALRWQAMNDAQKRAGLGMGIDANQNEFTSTLNYQGAMAERDLNVEAMRKAREQQGAAQTAQAIGTTAGFIAMGLSDERAKTDVRPADADIRRFLDAVRPVSYRYTDPSEPGAAPGRHVSPMAQDLESTPLGRAAVVEGPDGRKRVDYGRLLGTILAAEASLNKRINGIERKGV